MGNSNDKSDRADKTDKADKNDRAKRRQSEEEAKGIFGDTLKKVFAATLGGAFMTEEGVRSYLSELRLPKEILSLIVQGAAKGKEELTLRIAKEISGLLQKVDLVNEVSKFVEDHKFKINAEIEVVRKRPPAS